MSGMSFVLIGTGKKSLKDSILNLRTQDRKEKIKKLMRIFGILNGLYRKSD